LLCVGAGYIYSSGVTELVVGLCMGLAGATGILGTFLFTRLRKRLGLERTGLIAFSVEVSCLSLAVGSVWAPGSPFDLQFATRPSRPACNESLETSSFNVTGGNMSVNDTASEMCPASSWVVDGVNVSIVLLLVGIILSRVGK